MLWMARFCKAVLVVLGMSGLCGSGSVWAWQLGQCMALQCMVRLGLAVMASFGRCVEV